MMAHYAYLVVKRGRVALDQPSEKPVPSEKSVSSQEAPIAATSGDFPDRVRNTLDAAAKSVGYGTLERLMGSTRTLGRPTPSRAAHVRRLVEAGLVSEDESVSKMVGGAVPDAAWEILGAIHPDGGTGQPIPKLSSASAEGADGTRVRRHGRRFVDSWSLALHAGDGVTPIAADSADHFKSTLPLGLIAKTLETLASEGWSVVQVSEDRAIDDAASTSRVVQQRFLLRR
jgi:hypothetical protein